MKLTIVKITIPRNGNGETKMEIVSHKEVDDKEYWDPILDFIYRNIEPRLKEVTTDAQVRTLRPKATAR
jgi:hypothetical protein